MNHHQSRSRIITYLHYLVFFCTGLFIGFFLQQSSSPAPKEYEKRWDIDALNGHLLSSTSSLDPVEYKTESQTASVGTTLRVSCWISSSAKNKKKALAVASTWGKRCNQFTVMTGKGEKILPSNVPLDINESYQTLWAKTKAAFVHMYDNYHNVTDWYFKSDDDTYLIMENLKAILRDYDPNKSYYLGCRFKGDFMSGGAGYVLSREAVKRLVEQGIRGRICDKGTTGSEDLLVGECMHKLGTTIVDTTDSQGRLKFLALTPEDFIIPGQLVGKKAWYYKLAYYPVKLGPKDCCSDYPVTFHYISAERMFAIEYLLYSVKMINA